MKTLVFAICLAVATCSVAQKKTAHRHGGHRKPEVKTKKEQVQTVTPTTPDVIYVPVASPPPTLYYPETITKDPPWRKKP